MGDITPALYIPLSIIGLVVLVVLPIVVTASKGKYGMLALGVLIHPVWWFGAIRLAKPNSYWARRFYDADKLQRARNRFPDSWPPGRP